MLTVTRAKLRREFGDLVRRTKRENHRIRARLDPYTRLSEFFTRHEDVPKGLGLCVEGYTQGDLPLKCKTCGYLVCDYTLHREKTGHEVPLPRPSLYGPPS